MRPSTAQNLASLFRISARPTSRRSTASTCSATATKKKRSSSSSAAASSSSLSADDSHLKKFVSSIELSPSTSATAKRLLKQYKAPPSSTIYSPSNTSLQAIVSDSLSSSSCRHDDDKSAEQLSNDASSMLHDGMDLDWDDEYEREQHGGMVLGLPWLAEITNGSLSVQRKACSRVRKQKFVFKFKCTHKRRITQLVNTCSQRLGSDITIEIFGKLGKENGLKEYNALIKICIEKARDSTDEDVSVEQICKAYQILKSLRERGFKIEEETYGQFLLYLIDSGMVEEFFFFSELIRDENPDSLPRLAYYEMLLWIRVDNEEKIQELCHSAVTNDTEDRSYVLECLLMALCESHRRENILMLLESLDITKVSPVASIERVFRSLGKLLLEPFAERFLLALKRSGLWTTIFRDDCGYLDSVFLAFCSYTIETDYANSGPIRHYRYNNVEDIIVKFQNLHTKFELLPTSVQYEKLVTYCCEFFKVYANRRLIQLIKFTLWKRNPKPTPAAPGARFCLLAEYLQVHAALDVVDKAFESGIGLSLETFHSILDACSRSCEFNMVRQINSRISQHNLKPNDETIRKMVLLYVKMKDFEGAYELINDLPNMDVKPTASMYNILMAGYFREKKFQSAMDVLKQMEDADVKPNSLTYSYLINNCHCEKDIIKFFGIMSNSGVHPTKHVFMALINAYASCGQFENAKKVILHDKIAVKDSNDIKSVLIEALAENGQLSDAIKIYEEIKEAECNLSPKSIRCLIEHFQSEGDLNKSLELLEELNDSPYWDDACFTVISHCVRHENLRCTVGLLKQLKDKYANTEVALEVLFDEQGSTNMQFGLDLLRAIKEEVGVRPSRKSLDFLLAACVNAKDSKSSFVIWKEYESAGLPYNTLSFVRMYQALLASGNNKSAAKILNKTQKDDPHVRCVIKACQKTYIKKSPPVSKKQKKKEKKALMATLGLRDPLEAKTE
ncbi:hypothetical protein OROHE_010718 [Orobanche hederae]